MPRGWSGRPAEKGRRSRLWTGRPVVDGRSQPAVEPPEPDEVLDVEGLDAGELEEVDDSLAPVEDDFAVDEPLLEGPSATLDALRLSVR